MIPAFDKDRIINGLAAALVDSPQSTMALTELRRALEEIERVCNLTVEPPLQLTDSATGHHLISSPPPPIPSFCRMGVPVKMQAFDDSGGANSSKIFGNLTVRANLTLGNSVRQRTVTANLSDSDPYDASNGTYHRLNPGANGATIKGMTDANGGHGAPDGSFKEITNAGTGGTITIADAAATNANDNIRSPMSPANLVIPANQTAAFKYSSSRAAWECVSFMCQLTGANSPQGNVAATPGSSYFQSGSNSTWINKDGANNWQQLQNAGGGGTCITATGTTPSSWTTIHDTGNIACGLGFYCVGVQNTGASKDMEWQLLADDFWGTVNISIVDAFIAFGLTTSFIMGDTSTLFGGLQFPITRIQLQVQYGADAAATTYSVKGNYGPVT